MPDLVFTIKTPAELKGAEDAALQLGVNIGKAKALGKEHEELERRLATVTKSIEAYKAAAIAAAPPTAKLADESERYQKVLEGMDKAAHESRAVEAQRQIDLKNTTAASGEIVSANTEMGRAIEDAGEKTADAGKKAKLFGENQKEVKKAIVELSREFPIAGLALKAFANPIAAATTVAVGLFVVVKRQIDETNKKLDELEAQSGKSLGSFADALQDVRRESAATSGAFIAAIEEVTKFSQGIKTTADEAVSAIRRLEQAQAELVSAAEAKSLAQVNFDEERGAITPFQAIEARSKVKTHFAAERTRVADAADQAEINRRQDELNRTIVARDTALKAATPDGDEDRRKARIKQMEDQAAAMAERAADLHKQIKEAEEKANRLRDTVAADEKFKKFSKTELPGADLMAAGLAGARVAGGDSAAKLERAVEAEADLKRQKKQAENLRKSGLDHAAELKNEAKAAEDAAAEAKRLTTEIENLQRQFKELNAAAALNRRTRGLKDRSAVETQDIQRETDIIKEDKKAAQEEEREFDKSLKVPGKRRQAETSFVPTEPLPDLATEFQLYHGQVVNALNGLQQSIADARSQIQNTANV